MYDCQTCRVAAEMEALAPENTEAWCKFRRWVSRFGMDFDTLGVLFAKACEGLNEDEATELHERLSLIYDVCYPPRDPKD